MNWYLEVLQKYAVFEGRARRSEYWYFVLFNLLISIFLGIIDYLLFGSHGFGLLRGVYSLAVLVPGLAVSVRRLHDTNRSGWWLLLAFVPIIGAIVLLVFMVQDSQSAENQYGQNPKGLAA